MGFKLVVFVGVVVVLFALLYDRDTFNPESIKGKRVLITGASSGIGEELAYQYSKLGASIVITALGEELLQKVAAKCKELGAAKIDYIVADMASPEDRQKLVGATEKYLNGLDHLILNHGEMHLGMWLGTPENTTRLSKMLEVNFMSFVDITSRCLKMLTESKGNIGVISSIAGKLPAVLTTSYSTTKHAIQGFYASLNQELRLRGTGISVTICVLGFINTDTAVSVLKASVYTDKIPLLNPAPVNEAATAIIKAVDARKCEMYFPKLTWYILTVHKLFPEYIQNAKSDMVFSALKQ